MRIALIRREYITHLDGVNRFIALLGEGLAKLGHKPLVASWSRGNVSDLAKWFAEMHGLDAPIPIYTLREGPCSEDPWVKIAWDWWTKGSRWLRREADVAIVNGVVPLRFRPKIAVNHGIWKASAARPYIFAAKALYRLYDDVVCVSERLREEFRASMGRDCSVIPIPLKLEMYRPAREREDFIVHIGTRPVKNPHISIEAAKILRERGYKVKAHSHR
jgi:glycosyltransferase involved in cell wall biosynthesis